MLQKPLFQGKGEIDQLNQIFKVRSCVVLCCEMFVWCIDSALSQNLLFFLLVVVGSTIHSIVYVHMTVGECQVHGSSVVAILLSRLCIVKKTSCLVYYS